MATGDPGNSVVEVIQTTMDPHFSSFSKSSGAHRHSRLSHRPAPYPHRLMLREVPEIDRLVDELTTFNMAGIVSHYSREQHAVVEWDRGGLGFAKLQNAIDTGMLEAPHCIHAANPLVPLDHTVMRVHPKPRSDANGSYTGYLMAVSHPCSFKSYIPNLNLQKRAPSTDVEDNDREEEDQALALVLQRSRDEVSGSSSSSVGGSSSSSPAPITSSSPPSSPDPEDPKKNQSLEEALHAFGAEQGQVEGVIIASIGFAYEDKVYMYHPDIHPGFQSDVLALTPDVLKPYHPQTTGAPLPDMDDVYRTFSGIGIAHFNSTIGLKMQNFRLLKTQSIQCRVCHHHFSVYAFQLHTITGDDGLKYCGHSVERIEVSNAQALVTAVPRMRFRRYPLGIVPPNPVYTFNDATARAWLAWNSCRGVSHQTWTLISTGDQFCTKCQLSRSFAGHRIHLSVVGECRDPGEGGMPSGSDSNDDDCYDN
ncbi:hypothetical protein C8J56DRAFT_1158525 [Mycena floridula]|nr:hypothetical protein C8J56DRAFT_1158525 [Mycena floridula]